MTEQHPITPPPEELVQEWSDEWYRLKVKINTGIPEYVATQAARWGADQELEACCEYLARCAAWEPEDVKEFCDLRRPKPPSLAEQALKALQDQIDTSFKLSSKAQERVDLICAALERLQELEKGNE